MHIAYVTTYDSNDVINWSGLGYNIYNALNDQGISTTQISSLSNRFLYPYSIKAKLCRRISKRLHLFEREPVVLKSYARQVKKMLLNAEADIVFSPGTLPIAYLQCKQPIVIWTDATFAGMIDYYPQFSNLCKKSIFNGNAMEESALQRCKLAIYASDWAAKTALQNYQIDESKVRVVPFGANIKCDRDLDDIKRIIESRPSTKCKLLFVGVDWIRKGGNFALRVTKKLNQMGLDTELSIVGCEPPLKERLPDYVNSYGFLSKKTGYGIKKLNQLFSEAHFFILPARSEAFGIVFCEASSFGVPSIATSVGGIPTAVKDGKNGKLFPLDSDIEQYCSFIVGCFSNYKNYKALAFSSFSEYQSRLNWDVAGMTVKKLLKNLV